MYICGIFFGVFVGIGLCGYLLCGQVAFGVVTEIPGSLFYGTVRVEYAFERGVKLGLGLFSLHGPFLFLHGQTDSSL